MKVELKNIKYAAFASEETHCFEASLYINGKPRGTVSNEGHGGSDRFSDWQAEDELNTYAKNHLPPRMYEWDGQTHAFNQTAESIVQDLLNAYLARKQLQRIMRDKVVFLQDGKLFQTTVLKSAATREQYIKSKQNEGKTVLNTLPIDEAVKIFREVA
jgi:hypothetical protein